MLSLLTMQSMIDTYPIHPTAAENLIRWQRAHQRYRRVLQAGAKSGNRRSTVKYLAGKDLFYFLVYILHRPDADHPWIFARCREVQAAPDEHLDLWSREHYKSTIITFAYIIWSLIHDPERTFGIFSFTRPIAKGFLRQIKLELEQNQELKQLWPEVFWQEPKKQAPKWSEDDGIIIIRKGRPKESSVEAWGLVDGQPTSKHFTDLHFEDIVTVDTVRTPDMMKKTTDSFRNSLNLGTRNGRKRAVGTRWHYADTYQTIMDEKIMPVRLHTATYEGTIDGTPVLLTREQLKQKINDMGPYVASCNLFMDPVQDSNQSFLEEWLRYWKADMTRNLNLYLLCDPANEKKKTNDYTVFILIGLGADRNYYVVNWIRDRLSLTERANILFKWHQEYQPVNVGYEKYGKDSDVSHYEDRMERDNYRFGIQPLGGSLSKFDRIGQLVGPFSQGRIFIPESSPYVQYDGTTVDITKQFVNDEYKAHPFEIHDDMLDCLARILDPALGAMFPQGDEYDPMGVSKNTQQYESYDPYGRR